MQTMTGTKERKRTEDYTRGSIPRFFVMLCLPLIAGDILQQLYNTIDALVIGRFCGAEEFAAIGVASSVMNLFIFALVGICSGVSVLLAQSYGAGEDGQFRQYHFMATVLGGGFSIVVSILGIAFLPLILKALQTPAEIRDSVSGYLQLILAGYLLSFFYNLFAAVLRSVGKARIALAALLVAVTVNLGLDLLFVGVFSMGIRGAALATVTAQGMSVVFCIIYIKTKDPYLFYTKEDLHWNRERCMKMVQLSLVTCIHQISLYFGKLLVQGTINGAGTEMIAAYTAATRLEGFANSIGTSGSVATSILVAQNYGAGKEDRVKSIFWYSLGILAALGIGSGLLLGLTARLTVPLLLGSASGAAFTNACRYLARVAVFYVFCFTGNTFAGYFDGIGRAGIPFCGAAGHISLRVVLSVFWVPLMGLSGVAYATGIGWVLVNVFWSFMVYLQVRNRRFHAAIQYQHS